MVNLCFSLAVSTIPSLVKTWLRLEVLVECLHSLKLKHYQTFALTVMAFSALYLHTDNALVVFHLPSKSFPWNTSFRQITLLARFLCFCRISSLHLQFTVDLNLSSFAHDKIKLQGFSSSILILHDSNRCHVTQFVTNTVVIYATIEYSLASQLSHMTYEISVDFLRGLGRNQLIENIMDRSMTSKIVMTLAPKTRPSCPPTSPEERKRYIYKLQWINSNNDLKLRLSLTLE